MDATLSALSMMLLGDKRRRSGARSSFVDMADFLPNSYIIAPSSMTWATQVYRKTIILFVLNRLRFQIHSIHQQSTSNHYYPICHKTSQQTFFAPIRLMSASTTRGLSTPLWLRWEHRNKVCDLIFSSLQDAFWYPHQVTNLLLFQLDVGIEATKVHLAFEC